MSAMPPTTTYSTPLAFDDSSHSRQSWLWAISLLPELVGGIHAFAGRTGEPVLALLPCRVAIVECPHLRRDKNKTAEDLSVLGT